MTIKVSPDYIKKLKEASHTPLGRFYSRIPEARIAHAQTLWDKLLRAMPENMRPSPDDLEIHLEGTHQPLVNSNPASNRPYGLLNKDKNTGKYIGRLQIPSGQKLRGMSKEDYEKDLLDNLQRTLAFHNFSKHVDTHGTMSENDPQRINHINLPEGYLGFIKQRYKDPTYTPNEHIQKLKNRMVNASDNTYSKLHEDMHYLSDYE